MNTLKYLPLYLDRELLTISGSDFRRNVKVYLDDKP